MNVGLRIEDLIAISPLLVLLGGALILLLVESISEVMGKKISFILTLTVLVIGCVLTIYAPLSDQPLLTRWLKFDSLTRLFTLFFLAVGIGSTLLSSSFFLRFNASEGEYYFLLLSTIIGLILIGASADFLTLFLGLETLSIALYILCGYMKKWEISHEASIKYFLMGALATACLLYGIALIYGAVGSTSFHLLLSKYRELTESTDQALFLGGIALVTLGFSFKAAIVPFHVWAPDVYAGAPTPITAFMAIGTKAGAFAAFIRVFVEALPQFDILWNEAIAFLAYPTLIYANLVAIRQSQLRRFFAYSGISHAGFLLFPLAAGTAEALSALVFYLIVYAIATLGSFAVLAILDKSEKGVMIHDLKGLVHRAPLLSVIFSLCLLTLAGIPPTAGFFAKFYVLKVAFQSGYYGLVIIGLLTAILAAYYYLRIISVMLSMDSNKVEDEVAVLWSAGIVGCASFALIMILSFYPSPLLEYLVQVLKVV